MAKKQAIATPEVSDDLKAPYSSDDMNKSELIRKAVEAGYTKPIHGVAYIKEEFGQVIDTKYFSIVKGKMHKGEDEVTPKAVGRPAHATPASGGIVADIAEIRRLLGAHGEEGLKELIKVLR